MAPMSVSSGPGHAIPRASIDRVTRTSVSVMCCLLYERDGAARGVTHERRDAFDLVHERIEVVLRDPEHLHRLGARGHLHRAEILRLAQDLAPVLKVAACAKSMEM